MNTEIKLPKPIGLKLVARPDPEAEKIGSIYIPENAKEKSCYGTVMKLGTGTTKRRQTKIAVPFEVKEGDRILFSKFGGTEFKVNGESFLIIHQDDILALVDGEHEKRKTLKEMKIGERQFI